MGYIPLLTTLFTLFLVYEVLFCRLNANPIIG